MSMIRSYTEDSLGLGSSNEASIARSFGKMKAAMSKFGTDPFRNVSKICRTPEMMGILTESVKIDNSDIATNKYVMEDINRVNDLYDNVAASILNEAISNVGDLSPIMVNSFGIQERALISAHLPRAVKQVTAKIDNFKLTERIPYLIDLLGTKRKFIDAFVPDEAGQSIDFATRRTVEMRFDVPSVDINLYDGTAGSVVDNKEVFGFDSSLEDVMITGFDPSISTKEFGVTSLRTPNVEDGTFRVVVNYNLNPTDPDSVTKTAIIMGQFDLSNGKLCSITTSDSNVVKAIFKMVLSPETHTKALSVGYDIKHTPVNIPIGEHFEYSLSEEFKDASEKYYNAAAMALLTDYMGRAVEQVKDIVTKAKYDELAKNAVLKTSFNCTPTTAFAQGKEEYIRREFHPFIEKVCIILKNKVRIPQCHFRVVGNPLDIRIAGAAGVEYIYKRNEQFAGEIGIDYEFSVSSDVHKIFYLSSERMTQGKLYVFLIPNTIENNISTVNHYEYATYVSNKYRASNGGALPTVMISTRYLTKEYYPVMAVIDIYNNLADAVEDPDDTTYTGYGLSGSVYKKIDYVNK